MKIPKEIIDAIFEHATIQAPVEACGYLAGKDDRVLTYYRMTNIDQSKEHFSFDPEEQFRLIKATRKEGIELIGVYHSHPVTPARPSKEDIRLAYDPAIIYVIVSLADNKKTMKSFRINGKKVTTEPLEIL
jgi:proteasome lid subunit RPN8/RPN11